MEWKTDAPLSDQLPHQPLWQESRTLLYLPSLLPILFDSGRKSADTEAHVLRRHIATIRTPLQCVPGRYPLRCLRLVPFARQVVAPSAAARPMGTLAGDGESPRLTIAKADHMRRVSRTAAEEQGHADHALSIRTGRRIGVRARGAPDIGLPGQCARDRVDDRNLDVGEG